MKYIAYGCNLNIQQMKERCPTAKKICNGIIENHELMFRGGKDNAYATVEKKEGSQVQIGVWDIQENDLVALDMYEGYPHHCGRKRIEVVLKNGEKLNGLVYIMDNSIELNLPDNYYINSIIKGYHDFQLSYESLNTAYYRTYNLMLDRDLVSRLHME